MRFGELLRGDSRYAADQCVVGFLSAEYLADQLFGRLQIVLREECLTLELRVGYLSALARAATLYAIGSALMAITDERIFSGE